MIRPLLILFIHLGFMPQAKALDTRYNFNHSPSDYLLKNRGIGGSSIFDEYRTIELGLDLSSGVDCGRLDLKGTLKSSVDKLLDKDMFGNALEGIVGGAPLLTICYFSPTWCSIAKHFRVNAQAMSQVRLDQCALMDKYVDSRVEDYYAERQSCLHKELQNTGGNHEKAVSRCGGSGLFEKDIANWAGDKFGGKVKTNKLIESSAKWAGLTGPKAKKAVELVKAFVGDTTVSGGNISVEYGPRNTALSPKAHLVGIKNRTYKKLCGEILTSLKNKSAYEVFGQITDKELLEVTESGEQLLDQQSLYYLSLLPPMKRDLYCEKLSASIAMTKFSDDVGKSLQILTELSNNPNLPQSRKRELNNKRRAFKDSVEVTLSLEKQQNDPLNHILSQINHEGRKFESMETDRFIQNSSKKATFKSLRNSFFDCADGVFCNKGVN